MLMFPLRAHARSTLEAGYVVVTGAHAAVVSRIDYRTRLAACDY